MAERDRDSLAATRGGMKIRRYQSTDRDAVWKLHNTGLQQFDAHLGNGPWDDDLHDIENRYIGDGGEFLVGACQGELVAMGAFRRVSDKRAEIKRMRVGTEYQRRGFGEAILVRLMEVATELGYTEFCLDTTEQMIPARRLYEKHGFTEVRREKLRDLEIVFYERHLAGTR
jgi:ribosomal protein S18 acetylase RimI-like enzyme